MPPLDKPPCAAISILSIPYCRFLKKVDSNCPILKKKLIQLIKISHKILFLKRVALYLFMVAMARVFRTGSVSRDSVPLWKVCFSGPPSTSLTEPYSPFCPIPYRQHFPRFGAVAVGLSFGTPSTSLSEPYSPSGPIPHRQRFPRFAAVVAKDEGHGWLWKYLS